MDAKCLHALIVAEIAEGRRSVKSLGQKAMGSNVSRKDAA